MKAARANDLDGAIKLARSAIEKDPNLEQAYLLLGDSCASKDPPDDACEKDAYERGTAALPMSAALLNERGLFLLTHGDIPGGVRDLEKANEIAGEKEPKYMADLAYAYGFVDRLDDGDRLAKKARGLDPKSFYAANSHGEILLRKKDYSGAIEAFRAAGALSDDPEVKANVDDQIALAFALDGKYQDALSIWEKRMETVKDDPALFANAASVLLKMNRAKDALGYLATAAKLDPENKKILELMIRAQEKTGDKKGAEATKKKLAALGGK